MITIPATDINELWITGQIIGVTYYKDHNKLVFTLRNLEGKFCVEYCPPNSNKAVSRGDSVVVRGSLFSLRNGKYDIAKIRARLIHTLNNAE
jgi:hypothetical protein